MKELEKNVLCVLLQGLLEKNLIASGIHDKAKNKVLDTLEEGDFFCYGEEKREEDAHGHTQDSY